MVVVPGFQVLVSVAITWCGLPAMVSNSDSCAGVRVLAADDDPSCQAGGRRLGTRLVGRRSVRRRVGAGERTLTLASGTRWVLARA